MKVYVLSLVILVSSSVLCMMNPNPAKRTASQQMGGDFIKAKSNFMHRLGFLDIVSEQDAKNLREIFAQEYLQDFKNNSELTQQEKKNIEEILEISSTSTNDEEEEDENFDYANEMIYETELDSIENEFQDVELVDYEAIEHVYADEEEDENETGDEIEVEQENEEQEEDDDVHLNNEYSLPDVPKTDDAKSS